MTSYYNEHDPKAAQWLRNLIAAEREMAEKAWSGYRSTLYELVEIKMRLEAVELALRGES